MRNIPLDIWKTILICTKFLNIIKKIFKITSKRGISRRSTLIQKIEVVKLFPPLRVDGGLSLITWKVKCFKLEIDLVEKLAIIYYSVITTNWSKESVELRGFSLEVILYEYILENKLRNSIIYYTHFLEFP